MSCKILNPSHNCIRINLFRTATLSFIFSQNYIYFAANIFDGLRPGDRTRGKYPKSQELSAQLNFHSRKIEILNFSSYSMCFKLSRNEIKTFVYNINHIFFLCKKLSFKHIYNSTYSLKRIFASARP